MKKFTTKKRKINSKKGFSMVLAIALVAVLFLTTTSLQCSSKKKPVHQ